MRDADTSELDRLKIQFEEALDAHLPTTSELAPDLIDALRYSALGGGKRLRPLLVLATAAATNGNWQRALPAACAVECIHIYSLVHDDLPAMDDDDLRHGKPSSHIKHGEAVAILTGDALQALAFETLATAPDLSAEQRAQMVATLARAAGPAGMVAGQALDMRATGQPISLEQLQALHRAKTGALMQASVELGAIAGGADASTRQHLAEFAGDIGLAFQVIDDVLDVTQSTETLGKPAGSDEDAGKATYPALMGLETAQAFADALKQQALASLDASGLSNSLLGTLAERLVSRSH